MFLRGVQNKLKMETFEKDKFNYAVMTRCRS